MSTQFLLLNGEAVLYYLPVRYLGRYFPTSQTTLAGSGEALRNNSFQFSGKYLIHFRSHERDRIHGSKHGIPASAKAATPQGINDQFSVGPALDTFVRAGPSKCINPG